MLPAIQEITDEAEVLLARLRAFCFPGGEAAARRIRAMRTTEVGEIRMSPDARWIPFKAEQVIECVRSSFSWEARLDPGKLRSVTVVDAYQAGRGRLTVKVGGIIPVKKIIGPEVDLGELQRYFANILLCPPILLNHPALEFTAVDSSTLRIYEKQDPAAALVDIEISEEGRPLGCRAERPRLVGTHAVLTPWSALASETREWEGMRIPRRLEVNWHLAVGKFLYYRGEIVSLKAIR